MRRSLLVATLSASLLLQACSEKKEPERLVYFLVFDNSTSRPASVHEEYRKAVMELASETPPGACILMAVIPANPRRTEFSDEECLNPPAKDGFVVRMYRDTLQQHVQENLDTLLAKAERTNVSPLFETFYPLERMIQAYQGMRCEAWLFSDGLQYSGEVRLPEALDTVTVDTLLGRLTTGGDVPNLQNCHVRIIATGGGDADQLTSQGERKLAALWSALVVGMNGRMEKQDYGPLIYGAGERNAR